MFHLDIQKGAQRESDAAPFEKTPSLLLGTRRAGGSSQALENPVGNVDSTEENCLLEEHNINMML
jgi:hypothetical protein